MTTDNETQSDPEHGVFRNLREMWRWDSQQRYKADLLRSAIAHGIEEGLANAKADDLSITTSSQPQNNRLDTADGETPRDADPAETITGLPADKEAELRRLWSDNSLSHTQIGQKMGYDGDAIRKLGYKLGLPKRKSGRKSGK